MKGQDSMLPAVKNYLDKHRKAAEVKSKLAPYQIQKLLWFFLYYLSWFNVYMYQYSYAIETASIFDTNGCSINSGRVYLSRGSFYRHIRMKSLASSDTFVTFENFISSYIFIKVQVRSWQNLVQLWFQKALGQKEVHMSKHRYSKHQFCCYTLFFPKAMEKHREVFHKKFISWYWCWYSNQNHIF